MSNLPFREKYTEKRRKEEADRIIQKYPDRVPVIVERAPKSSITLIRKNKFLIPMDLTVGQFVYVIRKRIKLAPEEAIFLFINDIIPSIDTLMSELYEQQKSSDNFLYVLYHSENVFGDYFP